MSNIRVLVHGIVGRMGSTVLDAVSAESDMNVVGGVDLKVPDSTISSRDGIEEIPVGTSLEDMIVATKPDVMVDFTNAEAAMPACLLAASMGVNLVVGTTGLSDDYIQELERTSSSNNSSALIAANFALGAVLLIHLAKGLGRYFDYSDIIEMHHEAKIDSPSGTAIALANSLNQGRDNKFTKPSPEKETIPGTRGGDINGVAIHSVRMPGRMAHHEIILGAQGQTLSLKHDTIGRECYMPGVVLAIREIEKFKGVVVGLENIMRL